MGNEWFERLKAEVVQVTADQCIELEALVRDVAARRMGEVAVARRAQALDEARRCPHCGHTDVVKHGYGKAKHQRFRCRVRSAASRPSSASFVGTPRAGSQCTPSSCCASAMAPWCPG